MIKILWLIVSAPRGGKRLRSPPRPWYLFYQHCEWLGGKTITNETVIIGIFAPFFKNSGMQHVAFLAQKGLYKRVILHILQEFVTGRRLFSVGRHEGGGQDTPLRGDLSGWLKPHID